MDNVVDGIPHDTEAVRRVDGVYMGCRYFLAKRPHASGYSWDVAVPGYIDKPEGLELHGVEPAMVNARGAAMKSILRLVRSD